MITANSTKTAKKFPDPQPYTKGPRPAIALHSVESRQVAAIGRDEATKTLAVQFRYGAGAIYHYPGVERETFDAFMAADSKGTFFGKHIKALPFEKYAGETVSP